MNYNKSPRVQLITINQIRYEGEVYLVNKHLRTIILSNVICYGTEDRKVRLFIPPMQNSLKTAEFKAN